MFYCWEMSKISCCWLNIISSMKRRKLCFTVGLVLFSYREISYIKRRKLCLLLNMISIICDESGALRSMVRQPDDIWLELSARLLLLRDSVLCPRALLDTNTFLLEVWRPKKIRSTGRITQIQVFKEIAHVTFQKLQCLTSDVITQDLLIITIIKILIWKWKIVIDSRSFTYKCIYFIFVQSQSVAEV